MINAGVLVMCDETFKKLASKSLHEIDPQDPNLYAHLKHQLWEIFSPELIKKSLVITPLPTNPLSKITLNHDESCLPNLQTLLSYISKARRKPIPIDIIYEELNNISNQLATSLNNQLSTDLSLYTLQDQIKPLNQSLISVFLVHKDKPLMVGRAATQQDLFDLAQYSKMSILPSNHSPFTLTRQHPLDVEYDSLMTLNPLQIMKPTLKCTDLVHSSSLVRHCVAVTGDISLPSEIYVLEAVLQVPYLLIPSLRDNGLMGTMLLGMQLFLKHHKFNDVCRALSLGEVIDLQWQRPSESSEAQVPHSNTSVSLTHLLIEDEKLPQAQDFFIPSQVILPIPSSVANPDNTSDQNLSEIP
ncbi:alphaK I8 [Puccinia sorghi]|uniref:AlphaK I8 n=1 Tax=Puccinia sorghi TaxID=27349 RepID=A0A0L6V7K9_9BASI|nr:alphaK I8 [Puccinia sorghi]